MATESDRRSREEAAPPPYEPSEGHRQPVQQARTDETVERADDVPKRSRLASCERGGLGGRVAYPLYPALETPH